MCIKSVLFYDSKLYRNVFCASMLNRYRGIEEKDFDSTEHVFRWKDCTGKYKRRDEAFIY